MVISLEVNDQGAVLAPVKKVMKKAGKEGGRLLWDLVKDLVSETAKKIILGH